MLDSKVKIRQGANIDTDIGALGHQQRKGDMNRMRMAIQLTGDLVSGEVGKQIKEKKEDGTETNVSTQRKC